MEMKRKLRVAILFGGKSAEHEISIRSAKNVADAMDKNVYDVALIGIDRQGHWLPPERSAALLPSSPSDLSAGVWQALIATVAGLVVAIPSLTAYNYFVSKVNCLIRDMEISATDLVNILSEKKEE